MQILRAAILLSTVLISMVAGHMSMVVPLSRNAIDRSLGPWQDGQWFPYSQGCTNCTTETCVTDPSQPGWNPQIPSGCVPPGTDGWGCNCANGTEPCDVGQSCLWFSNGCTIGCKSCTGHPANPNTKDLCGANLNATICNRELRTYNRDATCNSEEDVYRHNPWRYPGMAPVFDSCGMAGGNPLAGGTGGESKITETIYTKQGDVGSQLPPVETGVQWKRGNNVTAKWSIRANHGGGYIWRLCPREEALTEECFWKTPLQFVTSAGQLLEWSSNTSRKQGDQHTFKIPGTYVSEGTFPPGATWAMNPLPYSNAGAQPEFPPPCDERVDRKLTDTPSCSGRDPFNTLIADQLHVPAELKPGKYVLGIRWDCEKSAQIWTNCADLEVIA